MTQPAPPAPPAHPVGGSDPAVHITVNMVLLFIGGALALFGGMIAFMATMFTGAFVDQYDGSGAAGYWVRFGGMIALTATLLVGIPAIAAGVGLSKRQEWGRILALVVASFNALIGLTLFAGNVVAFFNVGWAVYAFITLLMPEVSALFVKPGTLPHQPVYQERGQ